jgi:hypothetical protein
VIYIIKHLETRGARFFSLWMRVHTDRVDLLKTQNLDLIRTIVTKDNVNEYDDCGYTWLEVACSSSTPDDKIVLECMFECYAGAALKLNIYAMRWTAASQKLNCLRVLLSRGIAVDIGVGQIGGTPLECTLRAAYQKNCIYMFGIMSRLYRCARVLLDHGAKLSNVMDKAVIPNDAFFFVKRRERARRTGVILMGALKRKRMLRDLIPLIGQWVWSVRGL